MDTERRLWDGKAEITICPNPEGKITQQFALVIDGQVHEFFPSYTQALEEAIKIINNLDFEDN